MDIRHSSLPRLFLKRMSVFFFFFFLKNFPSPAAVRAERVPYSRLSQDVSLREGRPLFS